MSTRRRRISTHATLAAVGLGLLATMVPAGASVRGRRTATAALAAVAAYQLVKGHTTTGLLAAGGAAYAYKRTRDAQKAEARDARYCRYRAVRYRRYRAERSHHYRAVRGYRSRGRHLARGHYKRYCRR